MFYNSISMIIILTLFMAIVIKRNEDKLDIVIDFLSSVMLFAVIRLTVYLILGV